MRGLCTGDDDFRNVARNLSCFQIVAVEKKHDVRREFDPPIGRFDFRYYGSVIGSLLREDGVRDRKGQKKEKGDSSKTCKVHFASAAGRNFNLPNAVGT